jgi:hypothetical protein
VKSAKLCFAVVTDAQRVLDVIQIGAAHPVNLVTNQAKGLGLTTPNSAAPVELGATRVARPVRRRLTGLTPLGNERPIPVFYPIARPCSPWSGATRTRLFRFGESGRDDRSGANPYPGVRANQARSTVASAGSSGVATRLTGVHPPRRPQANLEAAKSSTVNRPQGPAGNRTWRRSRTGKC